MAKAVDRVTPEAGAVLDLRIGFLGVLTGPLLVLLLLFRGPAATGGAAVPRLEPFAAAAGATTSQTRWTAAGLEPPPAQLPGPLLLVDVQAGRFALYDGRNALVLSGRCSTGSNASLRGPDGRTWTFRTPRGLRRVHKVERPIWYRPDWAYVEEGRPIPAANDAGRRAPGVLGAYGIDIGDGYLIHGSPYRIDIGTKTTHGCVRLLDEDLELAYRTLGLGDPVLLF